jgi:hypothetical protein
MLVPPDGRVEFAIDASGRVREVEFHCRAEDVPPAVRAAADRILPGGTVEDCEKEHVGGVVYWEVSKRIDGRKQEVMLTADGRVHSKEIEIDPATAPQAVVQAAAQAVLNGRFVSIEEIRDAKERLQEYHVKMEREGRKYKLVLDPQGKVLETVRETLAEIEVPVRL